MMWTSTLLFIPAFLALTGLYYAGVLDNDSVNSLFLTLPTFLFALFSGFFVSRQSGRYGELRKLAADFDGIMSGAYRAFTTHFSAKIERETGEIIKRHYEPILKHGWDYPFTHKTSTITDLQVLVDTAARTEGNEGAKGYALNRIMLSLGEAQKIRKNMVALREERLPSTQWVLLGMLVLILFGTISAVPSQGFFLGSAIKSAFLVSILIATSLLHQLDNLSLFSGKLGEQSAKDVLAIIAGKR